MVYSFFVFFIFAGHHHYNHKTKIKNKKQNLYKNSAYEVILSILNELLKGKKTLRTKKERQKLRWRLHDMPKKCFHYEHVIQRR